MSAIYATVVTCDNYVPGAIALSNSLLLSKSAFPLWIICTKSTLLPKSIKLLRLAAKQCNNGKVILVESLPNPNHNDKQQDSPEIWFSDSAYTKLRIWTLDQLSVDIVLYLDADTIVHKNLDHLIEKYSKNWDKRPFLAAAPDIFPPDKFNAGVLLLSTNSELFREMLISCCRFPSYDGGDTGFLNQFFSEWHNSDFPWFSGFSDLPIRSQVKLFKLPFGCNAQRIMYSWTRKRPQYWDDAVDCHVIHYSSFPKPWERELHSGSNELERQWWKMHSSFDMSGIEPEEMVVFHSKGYLYRESDLFEGNISIPAEKANLWSTHGLEILNSWRIMYEMSIPGISSVSIPKKIHFIWFGPLKMPKDLERNITAWRELCRNSDWSVTFWTDEDFKVFVSEQNLVREDVDYNTLSAVQKSDVFRLELLYCHGGFYLDCDMYPIFDRDLSTSQSLLNLQRLMTQARCLFGLSNTATVEVNNGAIGCVPGHPFIQELLKRINLDDSAVVGNAATKILTTTGPGFLTKAFCAMDTAYLKENNILICPAHVFYPLPNVLRSIQSRSDLTAFISTNSVSVHKWACSWQTNTKQEISKNNEEMKSSNSSNLFDFLNRKQEKITLQNIASFLSDQ